MFLVVGINYIHRRSYPAPVLELNVADLNDFQPGIIRPEKNLFRLDSFFLFSRIIFFVNLKLSKCQL